MHGQQCTHTTCGHHIALCGVLKAAFLNLKLNHHWGLIMKMEITILTELSITLVSHTWVVNNSGFLYTRDSPDFYQKILTSLVACYIFFPKFKHSAFPAESSQIQEEADTLPETLGNGWGPCTLFHCRTEVQSHLPLAFTYSNSNSYMNLSSSMLSIPRSI